MYSELACRVFYDCGLLLSIRQHFSPCPFSMSPGRDLPFPVLVHRCQMIPCPLYVPRRITRGRFVDAIVVLSSRFGLTFESLSTYASQVAAP